jgi:uncharacterized protein YjbI with pentapeptide repeats
MRLAHATLRPFRLPVNGTIISNVIGRRPEGPGTVDLRYVNIPGADLGNALLRYANLRSASLIGANLHDADLSDAKNLTQAQLDRARGQPRRCQMA